MKLTLKKGERYIVGKNIFYSWTKYLTEDGDLIPEFQPIDKVYRNHAMYVEINKIKQLSSQFVEITFEPVSKTINGNAEKCTFIVYDDSIVQLPDNYNNYVGQSVLVQHMTLATPAVEAIRIRIDEHYKKYQNEMRVIKNKINALEIELDVLKQTESEIRTIMDEQYTHMLDETINSKLESIAYEKELVKYIDKPDIN